MVRSTARLLVVVMLLASGRLLACGWECIDQRPAAAEASCHQESAPATALTGDAAHACLPEVVEPRVRVAKPATEQLWAAAPLVPVVVTGDVPVRALRDYNHPYYAVFQPPRFAIPPVLRI